MTVTPLLGTTGATMDSPEGAELFERDTKSELFIAAVSTLGGDSAYESGAERLDRIKSLARKVALADPAWNMRLTRWLREEAFVRDVPRVIAAETVKARLDAGVGDETGSRSQGINRVTINVSCSRADEPSKVIEYWFTNHGRALPKPVKRGLADACVRLYNQRSALKYDTSALSIRFGDVLELVHPTPRDAEQAALFEWLLNRRHGHKTMDKVTRNLYLPTVVENEYWHSRADKDRAREELISNPDLLKKAGMTWENLGGFGAMDAAAWEAMIPSMGYMALLRNLRNFDQAKISDKSREYVRLKLEDPDEVTRSRQFPFRFMSAYRHASAWWALSLEKALQLSLRNVPRLAGNTLCLVDRSGSMFGYGGRSEMDNATKAALFGTTLAMTSDNVTLVQYGSSSAEVKLRGSVLETVNKSFSNLGGTNTAGTAEQWWNARGPFNRVIVLTDEQDGAYGYRGTRSVSDVIPKDVMLYTWNLGGHRGALTPAGPTRHSFGGLTDQGLAMIPAIESGLAYDWPF